MPGIILSITISVVVLYIYPTLYGDISDSPEINESMRTEISTITSPAVSDNLQINPSNYYEDSDGTKHYSINASDSPTIEK